MRTHLGDVSLKSGETMLVSCIAGPELPDAEQIERFLGHKGDRWSWHIGLAMRRPLDDLETRFYVGEIEGRIVGNVCTFECDGVGILGHVFTLPEHRHKGIAGGIMGLQMSDFRRRGGAALSLGTGYGSNAYRIYAGHGFRSIEPGSGTMEYSADPGFLGQVFDPGPVSARPATWGDWGRLNLLFLCPDGPSLRNLAYRWIGRTNIEGGYLELQRDRESGRLHGAWVFEKPGRIPVGFATVARSSLWPGDVWQLDLFVHPAFAAKTATLLDGIDWPAGKVTAHIELPPSAGVEGALEAAGFRCEGRLESQLRTGGPPRDVAVWGKQVEG